MNINRNSPLPLYFQLKELLLDRIARGDWKPGERLPTEEEIQQKFELSRTTVRQALRELELDGVINRYAGRGTFVSETKVQEGTESFHLDALELTEQGLQLDWKVIQSGEVPAPEEVAAQLRIPAGTGLFYLKRLRVANETAIGYATSYLLSEFKEQVDMSLAETGGTMNYLSPLGLERYTVERVVEALPAERDDAKILEVERCTPVLVISRVLRDPSGRPVEFFRGVYRGDRFRYHIQDLPAQI